MTVPFCRHPHQILQCISHRADAISSLVRKGETYIVRLPKCAISPKGLLEVLSKDRIRRRVEPCEDAVLVPLHAERGVALVEVLAELSLELGCPPEAVCRGICTPVQGRGHAVDAQIHPALYAVSSALNYVDLACTHRLSVRRYNGPWLGERPT